MKTFGELGTLPKVGDLIIRRVKTQWDDNVYMITKIIGDTYHISKHGRTLHKRHITTFYSPLEQENK